MYLLYQILLCHNIIQSLSPYLQVLDRDRMMRRFQEVTAQLEQTLGEISFGELDISDEVREQVEQSTWMYFPSVLS